MANRRLLKWVTAACGAILALVMVLAIVLNQREANAFATNGIRAVAVVEDKYVRKERVARVDQDHHCFDVRIRTVGGGEAPGSSCDRGIGEIYDATPIGASVRVIYLEKDVIRGSDGKASVLDFMLEDWADSKRRR